LFEKTGFADKDWKFLEWAETSRRSPVSQASKTAPFEMPNAKGCATRRN
jgi:hypothetical protein